VFNRRLLVSTSGGGGATPTPTPVPELPDKDTLLLEGFGVGTITIKIPEGCKVVEVFYDVYHEHDGYVQLDVKSVKTGVWWIQAYGYQESVGTVYIGVTGGAKYTLTVYTESETSTENGFIDVYYSKSINKKTPNKKDYIK
jgi:hypothetical protein